MTGAGPLRGRLAFYASVICLASLVAAVWTASVIEWTEDSPISRVGLFIIVAEVLFVVPLSLWINNSLFWFLFGRAFSGSGDFMMLFESASRSHAVATGAAAAIYISWLASGARDWPASIRTIASAAAVFLLLVILVWFVWTTFDNLRFLHRFSRLKAAASWGLCAVMAPITVGFLELATLVVTQLVTSLLGVSFMPPGYI